MAVEREHKKLITSTSNTELGDDCICKVGWAPVRTNKRLSLKVKDYLLNIYKVCESTGKLLDYDVIAEELKTRRNSNG